MRIKTPWDRIHQRLASTKYIPSSLQIFDRIYDDLAPFWALDPRTIRERIHRAPFMIRVRNGKVKMDTHDARTSYRIKQWAKVMAEIVFKLSDIDMAVNHLF